VVSRSLIGRILIRVYTSYEKQANNGVAAAFVVLFLTLLVIAWRTWKSFHPSRMLKKGC
jgi:hypothetical protein